MHSNRSLFRFVWMRWLHFHDESANDRQKRGRSFWFSSMTNLTRYLCTDSSLCIDENIERKTLWVTNHYKLLKEVACVIHRTVFICSVFTILWGEWHHSFAIRHTAHRDEDGLKKEQKYITKTSINKDEALHARTHTHSFRRNILLIISFYLLFGAF